ncbi:D-glycero-alpha-D-manno-heptose-1,7-bisphosphate 7-phosphatase [Rhodopseudomonas palustris]|uniref:D-glycero-alpha-D-manno-heptose-1,7-bisphosphate 7-phosphatase n=1 Tax=Rhodopseudomonas palustris TaxID=1076 RepID=UPI000641CB7D|nr:HAD-IIIA family hydrolase [Rhodopseudomonas palustris]
MSSRAVFLDRDGVLNHPVVREGKSYPPARVEDLQIYDGLYDPLRRLKDRGFVLIVVTNQPDVARGATPRSTVEGINAAIAHELPVIDRFVVCYHDNGDGCDCRKPLPGMLLAGAAEFDVDLSRSYMVGDRRGDIEAGIAAGTRTVFVDRGYREPAPTNYHHKVDSTQEALQIIESEIAHEEG